ncbi:uncharacterized protein PRCAT00005483001 [Priceomyces carsonii]|uniref:uncharacterized protein n=1 Tax=Priceomyces carsonii TaxID=28549 RepID=UPI002ED88646|nr:unnamed protein product [Priceomyces carsonii]
MLEPLVRLRNAVIEGNLPITKRLLSRFPELWLNVDPTHDGWCNLHYASFYGNYLVCFHLITFINNHLKSLRESFSHLDLLTFDQFTVLHLTCIHHHSQTLHYLLQEFPGAIWLNFQGGPLKQTPLHYSCVHGFKEGVTLLLEFGADWTMSDGDGNTCLHYCFQYGNYECMRAILKFILMKFTDKEKAISEIDKLEGVKNSHGWLAADYSLSFDLVTKYKSLKEVLIASDYGVRGSSTIAELESANLPALEPIESLSSQSSENKVLSSPIVPMSHSQARLQTHARTHSTKSDTKTSDEEAQSNGRAHSRSLPTINSSPSKNRPITVRQRSNTAFNRAQDTLTNTTRTQPVQQSPQTPTFPLHKTPSLKSVTISPSVRLHSASDSSPNSNSSIPTANDISATGANKITQASSVTPQASINERWPDVNSSPSNVIRQTIIVPDAKATPESSDMSVGSQSNTFTSSPSPVRKRPPERTLSRNASTNSESSLSRLSFQSSKVSISESPRRPSLSSASSYERRPEFRRFSSLYLNLGPTISPVKSSSTSTLESLSEGSPGSSKKSTVSSISFNRVR